MAHLKRFLDGQADNVRRDSTRHLAFGKRLYTQYDYFNMSLHVERKRLSEDRANQIVDALLELEYDKFLKK